MVEKGVFYLHKNYGAKHIFMTIGICALFFSPIIVLIVPLALVEILYYQKGIWLTYTPKESFVAVGVAMFFIVLACALLWLSNVKKVAIGMSVVCLLFSTVLFYMASFPHVTLSDEKISYRTLFSKQEQTYSWNEIERFLYYVVDKEDDGLSYYEFYFKDGEMLTISQNYYVSDIQMRLNQKVRSAGVNIDYIE